MPTYQYKCSECNWRIDVQHSIGDTTVQPECPNCNTIMQRQYNAPATIFKGTGWGKDR